MLSTKSSPEKLSPPDSLLEFTYNHDFDNNGALYFLGTQGMKKNWQNPHSIGMVKAFASSINAGKVSDFVGRSAVMNCRTGPHPLSFFGVDIGSERALVPTAYSLRNRNASTSVL